MSGSEFTASAIRLAQALVRNAEKRGEEEDPRIQKIAKAQPSAGPKSP